MLFRTLEDAKSDKTQQDSSITFKEVDQCDISHPPMNFQKEFKDWMNNKHHVDDFNNWVFNPGSLFGAKEIWWPAKYKRKFPHEGIDFYFYKSKNNNELSHANEGTPIELIFPGTLVAMFDDFIGKSILFSTTNTLQYNQQTYQFYVMYAHVKPLETLKNSMGKEFKKGDVVFSYPYQKTHRAPPHLHITTFWANDKVDFNHLDWDILNTSPHIMLVDPLSESEKIQDKLTCK